MGGGCPGPVQPAHPPPAAGQSRGALTGVRSDAPFQRDDRWHRGEAGLNRGFSECPQSQCALTALTMDTVGLRRAAHRLSSTG